MTENRKNSQMAPWRLLDIYKCGSLRSPQSSNRHGVFIDSFSKIINKKTDEYKTRAANGDVRADPLANRHRFSSARFSPLNSVAFCWSLLGFVGVRCEIGL